MEHKNSPRRLQDHESPQTSASHKDDKLSKTEVVNGIKSATATQTPSRNQSETVKHAFHSKTRKRAVDRSPDDDLYPKRQEIGRLSYNDVVSTTSESLARTAEIEANTARKKGDIQPRNWKDKIEKLTGRPLFESGSGFESFISHDSHQQEVLPKDEIRVADRGESAENCRMGENWQVKIDRILASRREEIKSAEAEADHFLEAFGLALLKESAEQRVALRLKAPDPQDSCPS
ncbi:uncharacterized protein B0I36DRAFT_120670 [Microdochium trichocladiopsis]|uniref:Uncharacterized protein n=1 Tax=Microdochium trichocladiopsis TaxID=1682393 RepID=A0A9P8Y6W2_9PEZI|nr:uncharacterized protein B0I36DRAFT_120670 [Microdochium trichocladiopsis]KAH7031255.1 hypothetical protein B0I36DRAFT_120670 [Microdochium trichocladiopsis]